MDKVLGERVKKLLREKGGIQLDLGGGGNPQPQYVNMDIRPLDTVDIVWNFERFPYPLPDECCIRVLASHVLEHINPTMGDPRVFPLIQLLLKKKLIAPQEVKEYIGEYDDHPILLRLMNEVWRIMKPGGQFMIAVPHGYSLGYSQDPTHIKSWCEASFAYFDPLEPNTHGILWNIYKPSPWKLESLSWSTAGNIECVMSKRLSDRSYASD